MKKVKNRKNIVMLLTCAFTLAVALGFIVDEKKIVENLSEENTIVNIKEFILKDRTEDLEDLETIIDYDSICNESIDVMEEDINRYEVFNPYSRDIYITVLPPKVSTETSFKEMNAFDQWDEENIIQPRVSVHFATEATENTDIEENAVMKIRGQSSRLEPIKSYRIDLFEGVDLWEGRSIVNIKKHIQDRTGIIEKLFVDQIALSEDMISFDVLFTRVYIRDWSENNFENLYEDYGMYLSPEQLNRDYLENIGKSRKDSFYKAEFFEFLRYEGVIEKKEDVTYSLENFEEILVIKGNDDHTELIEMLDAVNNYNISIDDIVEKYFDKDNLYTWLSMCILFNNYDTSSRNFYIYSPLNCSKWYILFWDTDKSMQGKEYENWQFGLSNYWGIPLFNRMFKNPDNLAELNEKMDELYNSLITEKLANDLLDLYRPIIEENVFKSTDTRNPQLDKYWDEAAYWEIYDNLPMDIESNYKNYYKRIESPMPFFINTPILDEETNTVQLSWGMAYDLQGDSVSYKVTVASDYLMQNILDYHQVEYNEVQLKNLSDGTYYIRVRAVDSNGNESYGFDDLVFKDEYGNSLNYRGIYKYEKNKSE